jgi:hypothetical protein
MQLDCILLAVQLLANGKNGKLFLHSSLEDSGAGVDNP